MLYDLLLLGAITIPLVWRLTANIWQRRQNKQSQQSGEQRYEALADIAPVGIFRSNTAGQCSYVNECWCQITGHTPEMAAEGGWQQTLHPEDRPIVGTEWIQAAQKNRPTQMEYRIQRPDGTVVWVYGQIVAERDGSGQVVGYVGTLTDIDDRKGSEHGLGRSEANYRRLGSILSEAILAAIPDYLVRVGADGIYRELVVPERDFALVLSTEIVGRSMDEFLPADVANRQWHYLRKVLQTGELQVYEQTVQVGDRTQEEEVRVVQSGPDEALFIIRDISDWKRIENSLHQKLQQEQALHQVVQAIRNSLDLSTIFTTATVEAAQLLPGLNCIVAQYHFEQSLWEIVAKAGPSSNLANQVGFKVTDFENPIAIQLKQGQIVRVDDTHLIIDPINRAIAVMTPGAWLLIPLMVAGKVWGSFKLSLPEHNYRWEDTLVGLAQAIANHLEVAIQQALLYQQVDQEKEKLLASQAALSQAQQIAHMGSWEIDLATQSMSWSDNLFHVFGLNPAAGEPSLTGFMDYIHPEDRPQLEAAIAQTIAEGIPYEIDLRFLKADGSMVHIESRAEAFSNEQGQVIKIFGTSLDIGDRKQAEAIIKKNEQRFRNIAANIPGVIVQYVLHPDGFDEITYVSSGCYDLLELTPEACIADSQTLWDLVPAEDLAATRASILVSAQTLAPWAWQYRIVTPSGQAKWLEATGHPERHNNGDIVWDTLILDVSDRVKAEEQLKHDALYDGLTGLPNRMLLLERLTLALALADRHPNHQFAVLFLDLDNFKVINDSLGHHAGDELLLKVATVLTETIRETDLAARLGGDEFVVLLDELDNVQEADYIAERITSALQEPFQVAAQNVFITASIGIVIGAKSYHSAEELLRDSDLAMYQAKRSGRGQYTVFESAMHQRAVQRLQTENDLRKALEGDEFVLHYQPVICLRNQTIRGFEALVRWQHPQRGLLLPAEFMAIAEEAGLSNSIGEWILHSACEQLTRWQEQFPDRSLRVSVNLSAKQLQSSLLQQLDLISQHLQPNSLILEITESMLIQNFEATVELLEQIKARHVRISIDDFGTGYSSLNALHQLPFDSLKIDRTFISPAGSDLRNQVIVEAIIALSNLLEIKVVAEGIETAEQLAWLQALDCELGQGYFFSPPASAAQATRLVHTFKMGR